MDIFWDIALHTVEILTLLFGVLGMAFSMLLLFSPRLTKTVGNFFNRNINVEPKISILDKEIETETLIYSHHVVFGLCMVAGSVFAFIFFVFNLNISNFANVFIVSRKYFLVLEIVFYAFAWIARVACILGIVFGGVLLFAPDKMRSIESKVNTWFETRGIFEKLDQTGPELDAFLFR
ncbi:MAG: hypothetical protein KAR15_09270, partial [Desulfobacterales bacterium]|nr:hypothetical protein [Desulfobacterales bacterium]